MRRVSVVGTSGSGKTTFAAALAGRLGVPHIELDELFHQPGWQPSPVAEFRSRVRRALHGDGWVVDGNYAAAHELVWRQADTVVWFDLPRWLVMRQITSRTLRRVVHRVELWNGNRERWRNLFSLDAEKSIIVWTWRKHGQYRLRYLAASTDPQWQRLRFVRIRSHRQAQGLLDTAGQAS
ncbi:adenylate kinase [Solwaraspora sp. WMMB335]|uniref:adenylate kinase n=1 Tax=Solwaraspora sp. WMMB335 TaxID=3404118 RepID=UPI003B9402C2